MHISLTDRFQREVRDLGPVERAALFEVILSLSAALGEVHRHAGLGLRKIHRSGVWEARVGLRTRLVFAVDEAGITLSTVGDHDDVRRWLRNL